MRATLGPQELVVLALKAPALAALAPPLAALLGRPHVVLPAMNGVPWWFLPAGRAGRAAASKASIPAAGCSRRCRSRGSSAASSTWPPPARSPAWSGMASATG